MGLLVSVCPAVPYGWAYTKQLERAKYLALIEAQDNYEATMSLPHNIRDDLIWWSRHLVGASKKLPHLKFTVEIFSDASTTGWGAICHWHQLIGKTDLGVVRTTKNLALRVVHKVS